MAVLVQKRNFDERSWLWASLCTRRRYRRLPSVIGAALGPNVRQGHMDVVGSSERLTEVGGDVSRHWPHGRDGVPQFLIRQAPGSRPKERAVGIIDVDPIGCRAGRKGEHPSRVFAPN
jgi:hypothetical protein